jgi:DNA-binding LacI/PurR family transcriptional regulator
MATREVIATSGIAGGRRPRPTLEEVAAYAQVSVVGSDHLDLATMTDPTLTTVRQPTVEMGRQMASLVLTLAERPHAPRARRLILPTELVTRQSA